MKNSPLCFICSASEDREAARAIGDAIERSGVPCWFEERDVPAGTDPAEVLQAALRASAVLVLVLSNRSARSADAQYVLELADHHRVPILPVRIDDVRPESASRLTMYLGGLHWLDASSRPLESRLDELVEEVRLRMPVHGAEDPREPRPAGPAPSPARTAAPPRPPGTMPSPSFPPGVAPPRWGQPPRTVLAEDTSPGPWRATGSPPPLDPAEIAGAGEGRAAERITGSPWARDITASGPMAAPAMSRPAAPAEDFGTGVPEPMERAARRIPADGLGEPASWVPGDDVHCTLFSPPAVRADDSVLLQVFVHLPDAESQIRAAALEFDGEAGRRGTTALGTRVARGSRLDFDLSLPGAEVRQSRAELVWQGRTGSVQFAAGIPSRAEGRTLVGTLLVLQDSVPIGRIGFRLDVTPGGSRTSEGLRPTGQARRFRKAFISYATADRPEVQRRVQMLEAVGLEFFQDLLALEPGDEWVTKLKQYIDDSDVMFLFWSSKASHSPWVEFEWRYGLQAKGEGYVVPIPIEGPPIVAPPTELGHLNFSERQLYFMRPKKPWWAVWR